MGRKSDTTSQVKYFLDAQGRFVIENYNQSKPFSNFFPGIAGLLGIPMWVFYVNRGQCIASFGIESKDKAIMEFQPANKAYRLTSLQGFRTFVKVKSGSKKTYWEPFQSHLMGTDFDKKQVLLMSADDLTLEETNFDLGLLARVQYFPIAEEHYPALVRRLTIKNIGDKDCEMEVIDGLPAIVPFGIKDEFNKHISRTVEAWVKVRHLNEKTPYYQLNVEVSDRPEVTHIKEGNFFFSFDPKAEGEKLLNPIVQASCVFGQLEDFAAPANFLQKNFLLPEIQQTSNRTPSAMSYTQTALKTGAQQEVVSLFGHIQGAERLQDIVARATAGHFIAQKAKRHKDIIAEIRNYALTNSSSPEFNQYASHTFLDNILRGGFPVSLTTGDGQVSFNVYSRKHGDLERDYNHFVLSPSFYSQGNGNYRDVNQNRRNDVWFNSDVRDSHLINFLNLSQADGYNPLVVKGTTFTAEAAEKIDNVLQKCVEEDDHSQCKEYFKKSFLPGALLEFINNNDIRLKVQAPEFLGKILKVCHKHEPARHGEGFWSDHWTYNLDMIESYLALYPEELKDLLLERKVFSFYHNTHYVLPREQRYVLTETGVRQYKSVANGAFEMKGDEAGNKLKVKNGEGAVYVTNLVCKILCLIANKAACLDPSGIGVEMEADKPNWYDALNGLPGLLGSSISETFELKRISRFLLESLKQLSLEDEVKVSLFEELATFVTGLSHLLSLEEDPTSYWSKSNDIKEHYRQRVRQGIEGEEKEITIAEIKNFLNLAIAKTDKAIGLAKDSNGILSTYFTHQVTEQETLHKGSHEILPHIRPLKFVKHPLPPFLEGYVHALRVAHSTDESKNIYRQVRESDLFDKKLKMYKVNTDLSGESEEIGRTRIFPAGWLENESIWLHMEYKFMLELLRGELYEEFYENFHHVLIPFLKPERYGRSILENSSFIVSSVHEDESLHGQGFVARLSGSTAEFLHMWLLMNAGLKPFTLNAQGELVLTFKPALPEWLFTKKGTTIDLFDHTQKWSKVALPKNTYAFKFLCSALVVYHNPKRGDTFGSKKVDIKKIELSYPNRKRPVVLSTPSISVPNSEDIRKRLVDRIDVYFE